MAKVEIVGLVVLIVNICTVKGIYEFRYSVALLIDYLPTNSSLIERPYRRGLSKTSLENEKC